MVTGLEAGGLVGDLVEVGTDAITITNSYAVGPVSGQDAQGLVGFVNGNPDLTVTSSYFHDSETGTIGTALSTNQMEMQASFTGWNFIGIWQLNPAISRFPSLRYRTAP